MKPLFTLVLFAFSVTAFCQKPDAGLLEKRAKEFHQAILKNDKQVWRKFMKENFTTSLIERPMRAQVETSESDDPGSSKTMGSESKLEAKLAMFQQLHQDFGQSKLTSLKVSGNKIEMILSAGSALKGIFSLEAEEKTPWLIDKMEIEVEAEN